MWILPILVVAGVYFAATSFGFLPPLNAATLIVISQGSLNVRRGNLLPHARQGVLEILQENKVNHGFIAIGANKRIIFSRLIPREIHQRLRNVLLNQ